jgi:hypothetical protein
MRYTLTILAILLSFAASKAGAVTLICEGTFNDGKKGYVTFEWSGNDTATFAGLTYEVEATGTDLNLYFKPKRNAKGLIILEETESMVQIDRITGSFYDLWHNQTLFWSKPTDRGCYVAERRF